MPELNSGLLKGKGISKPDIFKIKGIKCCEQQNLRFNWRLIMAAKGNVPLRVYPKPSECKVKTNHNNMDGSLLGFHCISFKDALC